MSASAFEALPIRESLMCEQLGKAEVLYSVPMEKRDKEEGGREMPIGIISNALVIIFGGIVGSLLGHKMSLEFKENMNMIFGAGAMTMGISSIMLMENLSAVIFSVVVGTAIGMAIHFGQWIAEGGEMMEKGIGRFIKKK